MNDIKENNLEESDKTFVSIERYKKTAITLLVIGSGCFLAALFLFLFKTTKLLTNEPIDPGIFGNFGDIISGVVGALWSLAGVLLFYAALRLQREDLILQREELKKSREIAESQSKTFHVQRFENTFFGLINLHHEIVKEIDLRKGRMEIIAQGRDCFKVIYEEFRSAAAQMTAENTIDAYLSVYEKHQSDLGHYFRNLYNIFKFIDNSDVDFPEKHKYANFARAQLSNYELLLLFYNCLSKHGKDKFKPLIEAYQILKHIPKERLIQQTHTDYYEHSAFIRPGTT